MSDADDRPLRRRPAPASSAPPPLPEQPPLPDLDAISAALDADGPEPPAVPAAPPAPSTPSAPPAPSTPPAPAVTRTTARPAAAAAAPDRPAPAPPAPGAAPLIEAPSDDVAAVPATSRVPGAPRERYAHLPTAPVVTALSGPVDGETPEWEPTPAPAPHAGVGPWALGLAIVALASSLFVGWMLPVALAAVVAAIVTLRRPAESRAIAVWALVLGAVAMVYSAGWLLWAIPQLPTG